MMGEWKEIDIKKKDCVAKNVFRKFVLQYFQDTKINIWVKCTVRVFLFDLDESTGWLI